MKQKFLAAVFILSAFVVNAQSGTTQKSKKTSRTQQSTSVTKDSAQLGGEGTSDGTMQSKHKSGKGSKMKSKTSTDSTTGTTNSADSTK